ncbi:MAG TPA: serine/threonine protein kinase, partial [Planctomycetaceae bacterium]|nr:serine/threonine protein kinase [Planctomycetaceae bacterium]
MRKVLGLSLSGCLLIATTLSAGDWAEFRGPTGQGHAAGSKLPTEWSAKKNVAWKAAIPGKGWSSPIIVGERVFLTTAVPPNADG